MPDKPVVLITNIPNHYRIPLFNELSQQLGKANKSLHVIFGAHSYEARKTKVDLDDCKFDFTILDSKKWKFLENDKGFLVYEDLLSTIKRLSPIQILVGGFSLATIKVCFFLNSKKTPLYLWSGAISNATNFNGKLREIQRKLILKRINGVLAYSNTSKKYFGQLGISESKVTVVGNTVDVSFLMQETHRLRQLNPKSKPFQLTYIGYLTKRKAVQEVIQVFKELLKLRGDVFLNIVGSGEEEMELKKQVRKFNLSKSVSFHGFIQKDQIPEILAKSDLFLYQTNFDIWGLVLNEAMASGVPCFSSVNAVSTNELIVDNQNGFIVDFKEHEFVANRINKALRSPEELSKIAENAQTLIMSQYSLKSCAARMNKALLI